MKVVMVSGEAGSGKDTFFAIANKHFSCVRFAFADALKDIATRDFDWDGRKDVKGRQLLIDIGTIGRKYRQTMWADKVLDGILRLDPTRYDFAIITDFRYENEFEVINRGMKNKNDLYPVRIHRIGLISTLTEEQRKDESETGLSNFWFRDTIVNSDITSFEDAIVGYLETIGGERLSIPMREFALPRP